LNKETLKKLVFKLMLIYVIAGIIGFIYETVCVYINDGEFYKRGTTFGPWIPIYGFGCLLIYFLTVRFRKKTVVGLSYKRPLLRHVGARHRIRTRQVFPHKTLGLFARHLKLGQPERLHLRKIRHNLGIIRADPYLCNIAARRKVPG
jgi:hypothetical protein